MNRAEEKRLKQAVREVRKCLRRADERKPIRQFVAEAGVKPGRSFESLEYLRARGRCERERDAADTTWEYWED